MRKVVQEVSLNDTKVKKTKTEPVKQEEPVQKNVKDSEKSEKAKTDVKDQKKDLAS